ncbi:unnamed protein product [Rhodiola kirilowii]
MEDVFTWLVSFFVFIALVVLLVYQLMCLSDLEYDYINAYDTASRVNKVVLPEFITQGVSCIFLLSTGHWFVSLLGVPYLLYNTILYFKREHLLDVTEIFNTLNQEKKKRHYKLGYIVVLLCLSLFWLLLSTMEG